MLYEYQTEHLLERLRAGEIDVGILALPVAIDGLESAPLYDEPFMLAVPASHPLAERDRVKVEDLRGETLLLLEDGHCLRDQALEVCSRIRVSEEQDYRATSLETLRQMVAAGHGITLLPELAAETPVGTARGLRVKPFAKPAPGRTIGAVWRKSTTRTPAIDGIVATIRSAMKDGTRNDAPCGHRAALRWHLAARRAGRRCRASTAHRQRAAPRGHVPRRPAWRSPPFT